MAKLHVQLLRAWGRRTLGITPQMRNLLLVLFALVFAYRLLLPQQHSQTSIVAAGAAETWLPPPWVGHPPPVDPLACTPQLLIIGVMKGGTTALFHYLNGSQPASQSNGSKSHVAYSPRFHPAIIGTHVTKELHFFDKLPSRVQNQTQQHAYFGSFPGVDMAVDSPLSGRCSYPASLGLSAASRPGLVRMEATAMYLAHPATAGNVKSLLPQARLVALLREPVSRALSSVNMLFQRSPGFSHLQEQTPEYNQAWQQYVITTLRRQLKTLTDCFTEVDEGSLHDQIDRCVFQPTHNLAWVLHIHVGLYAVHLGRWFSHFTPNQLLIWSSYAFDEKPRQHMEQLVDWLGLDPELTMKDNGEFQKLHERSYPTGSLPASLFRELNAFFEPQNQRLFALLEQQGYHGLVPQLKQAWELELQETTSHLQSSQI